MLKYLLNILKIFAIVAALVIVLSILGKSVNELITWSWLTIFFSIIHKGLTMLSFFWDISTLWGILGISLNLAVLYWTLRGTLWAIRWYQGIN